MEKIFRYLLDKGVNLNVTGRFNRTPLVTLALFGSYKYLDELIKKGADINMRYEFNLTILGLVVKEYRASLVERGIGLKIAKILLENGADIEAKDRWGRTPLDLAVTYSYTDMIVFLLKNGANINCVDEDGQHPLHTAVLSGNLESVQLLLKNGADIEAKDKHGHTARRVARDIGRPNIYKYLISMGAKKSPVDIKEFKEWLR